ncbi:MAG: metallophosphoesterase [Eubacteriales bacterium]|nr:metallophosphoesterase [Eubacteriales bacterium]MDD4511705.1 metallophosphoesterase [Eubacteriales bacterium]
MMRKMLALMLSVLLVITSGFCLPGIGRAETVVVQNEDNTALYEVPEGSEANKIVVISDLHLGVDDAYSETVNNKPLLAAFLHRVATTDDIAEVVIAGDFFDEWFQPFDVEPHTDSGDFYRKVAQNNEQVVNAINELITTYGKKVTYVPGNHDITLDFDTVAALFPGIHQARDVDGLGVYRTGLRNEIVIEHGHRYNVFVAPDAVSNSDLTDGKSILPPGYFFTRIAATSVEQKYPSIEKAYPSVANPGEIDESQYGAYLYYKMWMLMMNQFPVNEGLDDPVIDAGFSGFPNAVSINDVIPAIDADGKINAALFRDFQDNWEEIQTRNLVTTHISFNDAVMQSASSTYVDSQAITQYFNMDPTVEVVVFGHTHVPLCQKIDANKVYANSGTWIDTNTLGETATFVLLTMGEKTDTVELYQYTADGTVTLLSGE